MTSPHTVDELVKALEERGDTTGEVWPYRAADWLRSEFGDNDPEPDRPPEPVRLNGRDLDPDANVRISRSLGGVDTAWVNGSRLKPGDRLEQGGVLLHQEPHHERGVL